MSMRSNKEVMTMYEEWLVKHQKVYNGLGEKDKRFEIFKDNLGFIDEHNAQNYTYKVGLNKFADITNEEYRDMYLGTRNDAKRRVMKTKITTGHRYAYSSGDRLPVHVDWRLNGAVSHIKDQGSCGMFVIFLLLLFLFLPFL
jgi:C1A family cysteine protease